MTAGAPRTRANAFRLEDLGPDLTRALRVLVLLALVGGAVFLTSHLMGKAQAPAKRLLGL